ncbi:hypothetical protein [Serratia marcescens]|uniref:hypothetical protein n=1 Tax=Serratia marcescens TaxID=615 RepID=UPI0018D8AB1A|nr:hypothetical protein [Serratia marcescens]MBH2623776.1 hypothetical protein [Serratia marcescens]MCW7556547.1 hypothetical protein [Serratia marcescens]MCW7561451.1 hypothetical protein [Serratia marcescens]MCW7567945.1 hypothetical protein [Serratia marcescens]MCW7571455.1 hypothetical protein [Serratia marcescens]
MNNDFDDDHDAYQHTKGFTRLGIAFSVIFFLGLLFLLSSCMIDEKPIPWMIASALALMAALSYLSGKIIDGVFCSQD